MESSHSQHRIGETEIGDVLRFQADKEIRQLFKTFLVVIEDLTVEHDAALGRIEAALPDQYKPYIRVADWLDETKASLIRSKILDAGNNCLRAIDGHIQNFDIGFKTPQK